MAIIRPELNAKTYFVIHYYCMHEVNILSRPDDAMLYAKDNAYRWGREPR